MVYRVKMGPVFACRANNDIAHSSIASRLEAIALRLEAHVHYHDPTEFESGRSLIFQHAMAPAGIALSDHTQTFQR